MRVRKHNGKYQEFDKEKIEKSILENTESYRPNAMVVWLGYEPELNLFEEKMNGKVIKGAELICFDKKKEWALETTEQIGNWLIDVFPQFMIHNEQPCSLEFLRNSFESEGLGQFDHFMNTKLWKDLVKSGLLVL